MGSSVMKCKAVATCHVFPAYSQAVIKIYIFSPAVDTVMSSASGVCADVPCFRTAAASHLKLVMILFLIREIRDLH